MTLAAPGPQRRCWIFAGWFRGKWAFALVEDLPDQFPPGRAPQKWMGFLRQLGIGPHGPWTPWTVNAPFREPRRPWRRVSPQPVAGGGFADDAVVQRNLVAAQMLDDAPGCRTRGPRPPRRWSLGSSSGRRVRDGQPGSVQWRRPWPLGWTSCPRRRARNRKPSRTVGANGGGGAIRTARRAAPRRCGPAKARLGRPAPKLGMENC